MKQFSATGLQKSTYSIICYLERPWFWCNKRKVILVSGIWKLWDNPWQIHYWKIIEGLETTMERSYWTFLFVGNGLAANTNKYCYLMQLSRVVLCAKNAITMSKIQYTKLTVQECIIILCFAYNFPQLPWYPSFHCESMKITCAFR